MESVSTMAIYIYIKERYCDLLSHSSDFLFSGLLKINSNFSRYKHAILCFFARNFTLHKSGVISCKSDFFLPNSEF